MSEAAAEIQTDLALDAESSEAVDDGSQVNASQEAESETENVSHSASSVEFRPDDNPELAEILNEATTTQAEARETEKQEQARNDLENKPAGDEFSQERSMAMAIQGLDTYLAFVSAKSGVDLDLPNEAKFFVAVLVAPAIMKHGKAVERYLSGDRIDLNSKIPEGMAAVAAVGVGGYTFMSIKGAKKASKRGAANGDKS